MAVTEETELAQARTLDRAWWSYWKGDYSVMHQSLLASFIKSEPAQRISQWITYFQQRSQQRKHLFEVDCFTDLVEWNRLIEQMLTSDLTSDLRADCHFSDSVYSASVGRYISSKHSKAKHSFILYRILGSDLPPRHYVGQTLKNLQFILAHEPPLHHCQKRWIVNRIVDKQQEKKILETLDAHHQTYRHISFDEEVYAQVSYDFDSFLVPDFLRSPAFKKLDHNSQIWASDRPYRPKNLTAINLNAVRNQILDEGRQLADWTLVLDGGCFMTQNAWRQLLNASFDDRREHECKHLIIPMVRLTHNDQLFSKETIPPPTEEPQIAVHKSSAIRFDESLQYGRFTKVELFRRLQVPGVWDQWNYKPWEHKQWSVSDEAGQWKTLGRIARLSSGHPLDYDQSIKGISGRTVSRQAAVWQFLDRIDERIFRCRFDADNLLFFNQRTLTKFREQFQKGNSKSVSIAQPLLQAADQALSHPAYAVVQKANAAPSGDIHDYWSLSAFSWPDPTEPDGLPYTFRDGERLPETELYSAESNQYDQTRLQYTFKHTTVLAIAWYITGHTDYATHAAKLVRTWFLDPKTRMNPHLEFAQVELGRNNNRGMRWGVIDTKDFYYFLDAVRLLRQSGVWSERDHSAMQSWCRALLDWLNNSAQGRAESCSKNNHGTCYDLQKAALSGFCDNAIALYKTLEYSKFRFEMQFKASGLQPHELSRKDTLHYHTFNLQVWSDLAHIAEQVGIDLWHYKSKGGGSLEKAFQWLLPYYNLPWPYSQVQPFSRDRLCCLCAIARNIYPSIREDSTLITIPRTTNMLPHPYAGIAPGWMFALNMSGISSG